MSNPYAARRGELQLAIAAAVAEGRSLHAICAEPGMPGRSAVHQWMRASPAFAEEIARARRQAETRRVAFHEDIAARIVDEAATGRPIRDILTEPWAPSGGVYIRWRRQQAQFAADLYRLQRIHDVERGARCARRHARPFDRAIADRIYLAVLRGAPLKPTLRADPAFPSYHVIVRWRREEPEFDHQMTRAISRQRGQAVRAGQTLLTPDLTHEIAERVVKGETLAQIARDPDMPSVHTLYSWARKHRDVADALAAAREAQAHWTADQVLIAAEDAKAKTIDTARRKINRLKRRADYLRKRDARWAERYGG